MKLSEAMRLGAMMRPQAYRRFFGDGKSCALGAAGEAVGLIDKEHGGWVEGAKTPSEWKWVRQNATCPVCGPDFQLGFYMDKRDVQAAIVHLNNDHQWTREAIADCRSCRFDQDDM